MEIWPNFFIVGAPRAGTTSLYDYLKRTKGVFMSKVKEPEYFSNRNDSFYHYHNPPMTKKKYLDLFKKVKDEKAIGDASTSYLSEPITAESIFEVIPHAKIIIMLRDPVERAYSQYLWRKSKGRKILSFSDEIKTAMDAKKDRFKGIILTGSWYYEQVKRYLDVFGKNQVKILFFEEFVKEPKKFVKEVLEFLGVDSVPPDNEEIIHNVFSKPRGRLAGALLKNEKIRQIGKKVLPDELSEVMVKKIFGKETTKPEMDSKDRKFLEDLYRDDVESLQKLLGRKLPWSLTT